MGFGGGIGQYADDMATYFESVQEWLLVASEDLRVRNLLGRRDIILGIPSIFGNAMYDTSDMDKQLAVLALAMATGTEFELRMVNMRTGGFLI